MSVRGMYLSRPNCHNSMDDKVHILAWIEGELKFLIQLIQLEGIKITELVRIRPLSAKTSFCTSPIGQPAISIYDHNLSFYNEVFFCNP